MWFCAEPLMRAGSYRSRENRGSQMHFFWRRSHVSINRIGASDLHSLGPRLEPPPETRFFLGSIITRKRTVDHRIHNGQRAHTTPAAHTSPQTAKRESARGWRPPLVPRFRLACFLSCLARNVKPNCVCPRNFPGVISAVALAVLADKTSFLDLSTPERAPTRPN